MSSPSRTLVVLGATGNQGGAVLRYFAKQKPKSFHLRGITRDPTSDASKALQSLGVEVVQADLNDLNSLTLAFSGATHIFANTDSNQLIFSASKDPSILLPDQTPLTYAQEIEEQHGRNIVEAAAATVTLERIIWSSLESPRKWSQGKYTKVTMFDAKENIADLMREREGVREKLSLVIVGFYTRNALKVSVLYSPQKQSDGVYELSLPMSGDTPVAMADTESDLGSWTEALFEAAPGIALTGASQMMSWSQWVEAWSTVTKLPGRYRKATEVEWTARTRAAGIEIMGEAVLEEFSFVDEYGLSGSTPGTVYPEDLRKQGIAIKTTPVVDTMSGMDWSSIV